MKNSLDPKFAKSIRVDYYFEEVQKVTVAVYDVDNSTPSLSDDDFLGQLDCTIGQVSAIYIYVSLFLSYSYVFVKLVPSYYMYSLNN